MSTNIAVKELTPIYLAITIFAPLLANKNIVFWVDNMSVVQILRTQTSKDIQLMNLLRKIVVVAMKHNINFYSAHIPGRQNVIADLISRSKVQKALQIAPWLQKLPTPVPPELLPW